MSLRDVDGHGSHSASTVVESHTFHASMGGYAIGIAKATFDAANDDIDVISILVGSGDIISSPYYLDLITIGAYDAASL
ncbi:hypothetical protein V6N12_058317 [Hibiscus sabdariffa]|uniref:Peptidase S8/S53 domain-containing protein n=1 Tax=Hibiscus sabdariffa TaxID=183260 RepID=A0ABR2ERU6_9ROSI